MPLGERAARDGIFMNEGINLNYGTELVNGVFIEESKNRFLCKVMINGELCECYVPSSSRIENYLKLKNKEVLLSINKGVDKRTKYSLFAVKYYRGYILLNLNLINTIVESLINQDKIKLLKAKNIQREQVVNGYKTDLLLTNKSNEVIIVEIKGIISSRKEADFPSVYSERAITQLYKIRDMLLKGEKIYYLVVSLSPSVRSINIDEKYEEYVKLLMECQGLGMVISSFSIVFKNNVVQYNKKIKVNYPDIHF